MNNEKQDNIQIIGAALDALADFRVDERGPWLRVGMAIHSGTGGSEAGLNLWDSWSRQSEKYRPGECPKKWRGFKADGKIGLGTLFHMAGQDSPGFKTRPDRPGNQWQKTRKKPKPHHKSKKAPKQPKGFVTANEAIAVWKDQLGPISMFWEYQDANLATCGYVLRWNLPDGEKTYRPVSRGIDGLWYCKAMPEPRPIYNLPYIRESGYDEPVVVCEGEKGCNVFDSHHFLATTSSGGAGAAKHTDWSPLAERVVIICPDNGSDGTKYLQTVIGILQRLKPPADVRVMPFPADEVGPKGSAADWLAVQIGKNGVI